MVDFYYQTRSLLYSYGQSYTGIYLALLFSFAVIVVKKEEMREYAGLVIGLLAFLLFPGVLPYVGKEIWEDEGTTDLFMLVPTILLMVVGFSVIGHYYGGDGKKKKVPRWVPMAAVAFFLVLVEASVPFQWTFANITTPGFGGKYNSDVVKISNVIDGESVFLPRELQISIQTYRWDTMMPVDDYADVNRPEWTFAVADANSISYVVIPEIKTLGDSNQEFLSSCASECGYSLVDNAGKYLIYEKKKSESF